MIRTYKDFEEALEKSGKKLPEVYKHLGLSFNYFWKWKVGKIAEPKVSRLDAIEKFLTEGK